MAAFTVVIGHFFSIWLPPKAEASKLELAFKVFPRLGHPSVILFFVLSGFVLTLAVGRDSSSWRFFWKRIARLFPPLIAAVALSVILYFLTYQPLDWLGGIFWSTWRSPPTLEMILRHISLIGIYDTLDTTLDGPIWSLVYEFRISAVFPMLVLVATRAPTTTAILSVVSYVAAAFAIRMFGVPDLLITGESAIGSAILTLHYLPSFTLGIGLAQAWRAGRLNFELKPIIELIVLTCALLALVFESDALTSLAAGAVIIVALRPSLLRRTLDRPFFLWLGTISYSLYLFHVPVIVATLHAGHGLAPLWLLLPMSVVLSFVCAALAYRFIEKPSIRLARRI